VVLGGTLVQHLEAGNHRDVFHAVDVTNDSRVSRAMSTSRPRACHSFHHQAIDRLGSNLTVTATSDDGIIEAVEHTDRRWVVGVQWHPEDSADVDAEQQGLFDEFVSQCVALRRGPDTAA
jgi:putative glutamine amidotransferase